MDLHEKLSTAFLPKVLSVGFLGKYELHLAVKYHISLIFRQLIISDKP